MFEFNYALTEKDLFDFSVFNYFYSPLYKRDIYLRKILVPALFALLSLFYLYTYKFNFLIAAPYVAFFVFASVLYLVLFRRISIFNIKRSVKRVKKFNNDLYDDNQIIKFLDDDIVLQSDTSEGKLKYSNVKNVVVTKNAVYLYIDTNKAFILPQRFFENPDNQDKFLDFLKEKINLNVTFA